MQSKKNESKAKILTGNQSSDRSSKLVTIPGFPKSPLAPG